MFDVLPEFFYHHNEIVRMAALEVRNYWRVNNWWYELWKLDNYIGILQFDMGVVVSGTTADFDHFLEGRPFV